MPYKNKEEAKEHAKRYYQENKERLNRYLRDWYKEHKEELNRKRKSPEYIAHKNELRRKWRFRMKTKLFNAYGGAKCKNCGITDMRVLDLDHLDNNGCQERKKLGGTEKLFFYLIKNNFPPGYQILCRNCNWIKRLENMR